MSRKVNIIHPGEVLMEEFIVPMNMSVDEFAVRTGIEPATLIPLIQCSSPVTKEIADKLSKYFGMSAEFWVNLQTSYDNLIH